uniref:Uncharacterized protein n=1 Tax=Amphimedon queenslandica TaxID=400682 RepID=A0A1X7TKL2_AMPQE
MAQRTVYIALQCLFGAIFPLFIVVPMIVAGKLRGFAKLVRTMFPYIKRNGMNTVMFGFIISDKYMVVLFIIMLINVYFTMAIFFINVFIKQSNAYNPFEDFDCFYTNGDEINPETIEEAFELRSSNRIIECYAWQLNIAGAVGQATATLLFSWAVVSVVTWIMLKAYEKMLNKENELLLKQKIRLIALQGCVYLIPIGLGILISLLKSYNIISTFSFCEALGFFFILLVSSIVCWCCIEIEPQKIDAIIENLVNNNIPTEDETDKEKAKELIEKVATQEFNKAVASKVAGYLENEDINEIASTAFDKVIRQVKNENEEQQGDSLTEGNQGNETN